MVKPLGVGALPARPHACSATWSERSRPRRTSRGCSCGPRADRCAPAAAPGRIARRPRRARSPARRPRGTRRETARLARSRSSFSRKVSRTQSLMAEATAAEKYGLRWIVKAADAVEHRETRLRGIEVALPRVARTCSAARPSLGARLCVAVTGAPADRRGDAGQAHRRLGEVLAPVVAQVRQQVGVGGGGDVDIAVHRAAAHEVRSARLMTPAAGWRRVREAGRRGRAHCRTGSPGAAPCPMTRGSAWVGESKSQWG